jgi:hypothetical protein
MALKGSKQRVLSYVQRGVRVVPVPRLSGGSLSPLGRSFEGVMADATDATDEVVRNLVEL